MRKPWSEAAIPTLKRLVAHFVVASASKFYEEMVAASLREHRLSLTANVPESHPFQNHNHSIRVIITE